MHHHKTFLFHGRKKDSHRKRHNHHDNHASGHHRGFSKIKYHRQSQEGATITSEHGPLKNRKRIFDILKSDISSMTYQTRETESQRDSGLKLSVDLERCVRCGKCEKVCPTGAIMVDEDIFRVDSSRCNECRQCVDRCRQSALSLRDNGEVFMH